MATILFAYKGYSVFLAALQPSKLRRGGKERSIQIRKDSQVKKNIRYDVEAVNGYTNARRQAVEWIDKQLI